MQSRFEVYEDKENLWRWRHIADNGEELSKSSESYSSKSNAMRARDRVIELAAEEWEWGKVKEANSGLLDGGFGRHTYPTSPENIFDEQLLKEFPEMDEE